ncbi:MAG: ACP S-malonyltransferase [Clostridiales Family XIII bacterium]|jgi:[acyl-carrier-protein] S-malonyltransferase|nr:ACP S-malonyltransferase [Clostridiales Family XIII bacterium]
MDFNFLSDMVDIDDVGIVCLFSGQGAQKKGMGKSLYEGSKIAKSIYDLAGDEIKRLCFEGSDEELSITTNTQPAVYTTDLAAYYAFAENYNGSYEIRAMAGFSLGEFAAYTANGVFKNPAETHRDGRNGIFVNGFTEGLRIVQKRAEFMDEAGRTPDGNSRGAMAAVFGDRENIISTIEMLKGSELRDTEVLEIANLNSKMQTVISGDFSAIEKFKILGKSKYRLKTIPLPVSTAFHSSLMNDAAERLSEYITGMKFNEPHYSQYMNLTGEHFHHNKISVHDYIVKQVKSPVLWQNTIEVIENEFLPNIYIEFGPGKTLTNLVKKITPRAVVYNIETMDDIDNFVKDCDYF